MEALTLNAAARTATGGKRVKRMRLAGQLPAVVYGHGVATRTLEVPYVDFEKTYKKAGESSLVDLIVPGAEVCKVLIQDVQHDPLTSRVSHVDFREVNMNEKLDAEVLIRFINEAPAVKELGGILVKSMDKFKVRCLPKDLVHEIDVDLRGLKVFGDRMAIKDIVAPAGIEFLGRPEDVMVSIAAPISEEELKALDTKVEVNVAEVKVEGEEKRKAAEAAAAAAETGKKAE